MSEIQNQQIEFEIIDKNRDYSKDQNGEYTCFYTRIDFADFLASKLLGDSDV